MKTVLFLFLLLPVYLTYSQDVTENNDSPEFFISSNIRSNFTGAEKPGYTFLLSGGYYLTENFSFILSTGYVTVFQNNKSRLSEETFDFEHNRVIAEIHHNGKRQFKIIPAYLSARYSFPIASFKPYAVAGAGYDFFLNITDYNVTIETKDMNSNETINTQNVKGSDLLEGDYYTTFFNISAGAGVLIPLTNKFNLDISYVISQNSMTPTIHSVAAGLAYDF